MIMIKRSLFALALLAPYVAYAADPSADLTVKVGPPSSAPPVPQQAGAQGFTMLTFDGDMAKGFDVSCANPATGDHQWYLGANRTMWSNCANLTYPHADETDGSTVLDIHLGPSSKNGGQQGRVGISTSDAYAAHSHNFPINAYYECVVRMDAYSISHMPLWHNCWMGDSNTVTNTVNSIEYDMTEFHGGYANFQEIAGTINWACGGPSSSCKTTAWFGNLASKIPSFDPSKFHKYGMLMYQTSATNLHVAGYVDDVLISEGDTQLSTSDTQKQRNYIIVDLTGGCNFDEGGIDYCSNQPIQKVFADANGNTHIQTPNATMFKGFSIGITGVTGVTSPINGNFGFSQDNWAGGANGNFGCVDGSGKSTACTLTLLDQPWGKPIQFAGSYTGGGMINQWVDPGMHVYVKSFRVWSCANWSTTQCSPFNSN